MTLVANVPNQVTFQNDLVVMAYVKQDEGWKRIWLDDAVDFYAEEGVQGNQDCRCTFMLWSTSVHFADMTSTTQIKLDWTRCGRYQGAFRMIGRDRKRDANGMLVEGAVEFLFEPEINALSDLVILHDLESSDTHFSYLGYPDDAIKECVRRQIELGTAYADPDGDPRGLDGWAVAADASEHATSNAEFHVRGERLLPTIAKWAAEHDVAYFVRIGWNSGTGALTVTFDTKVPRYGADRSKTNTEDNNPVMLTDAMDSVSALTCREDLGPERNTYYDSVFQQVWKDPARVALHGMREAIVTGSGDDALEAMKQELELNQYAKGSDYEIRQTAAFRIGQTCEVGDKISHQATFFGMPVYHEMLTQARYSYNRETGKETVEVTVGDPPPDQEDNSGSGGAWNLPMDQYWEPDIQPIAGTNVIGTQLFIPHGDHQHQALIMANATDVGPDDEGRWTFTTNDGTLALTVDEEASEIDFSAVEGASCLWYRDTTDDPFLRPKTLGDELRIQTAAAVDMFYVDVDGNIGGLATGDWRQALFRYYSFGDYATGVVGVHNINMAGDFTSDGSGEGEGSQLRWTNVGDAAYFRDISTIDGIMSGNTGWSVDEDGNTFWKVAAEFTMESVVYRAPLSAPTDTDMVLGVASIGGAYNQTTWRAGIYGTPASVSATSTNTGGNNHAHAVVASATPGAAVSLLKTDASGYLELVRLYAGGTDTYLAANALYFDASEYLAKPADGYLRMYATTRIDLTVGGAIRAQIESGELQLNGADLNIATAGKGLIMSDVTDGKVPVANGTRYAPATLTLEGKTTGFATANPVYNGSKIRYANSVGAYAYVMYWTGAPSFTHIKTSNDGGATEQWSAVQFVVPGAGAADHYHELDATLGNLTATALITYQV